MKRLKPVKARLVTNDFFIFFSFSKCLNRRIIIQIWFCTVIGSVSCLHIAFFFFFSNFAYCLFFFLFDYINHS